MHTGTPVHYEQVRVGNKWPGQGAGCGRVYTGILVYYDVVYYEQTIRFS